MDKCSAKRFGTEYSGPQNPLSPGKGSFLSGVPPLNLDSLSQRPGTAHGTEYNFPAGHQSSEYNFRLQSEYNMKDKSEMKSKYSRNPLKLESTEYNFKDSGTEYKVFRSQRDFQN